MITVDIQELSTRFAQQAREFVAAPSLMGGLDLDDVSMKLMQAVTSVLKDPNLMSELHRFRQACRDQNMAQLAALLEQIEDGLRAHQIDV